MTKTISAHCLDHQILEEKTANTRAFLARVKRMLHERPDLLGPYARRATEMAAGIYALPLKENGVTWLRRAARANALLFANSAHPDEICSIRLDAKTQLTVSTAGDASEAHAPAWVKAMWCAIACNDPVAEYWLAAVDESVLTPRGIHFNPYHLPYFRFLRALILQDGTHVEQLEAAIDACDEKQLTVPATLDEMDFFDYPVLKACLFLFTGENNEFQDALEDVLERHKRYWGRKEFSMAVEGLLSTSACALRRLAAVRGLQVEVSSPYMPEAVWQAKPPATLECCPYCISPKAAEAPHCALCGLTTTRDAPLELTTVQYRGDARKPCKKCEFRPHTLATHCPRCRTKQ